MISPRRCEYDDDTYEYWANTRTEGSLKREDVERLSRKRSLEQEIDGEEAIEPSANFEMGGFPGDLGEPGELEVEGDTRKSVPCMHRCILDQFFGHASTYSYSIWVACFPR